MADSTLTDAEHVSDQAIQVHTAPKSSADIVMETEIESNTRSALQAAPNSNSVTATRSATEDALQAAPNSNSVTAIVKGWIDYGKANRKRLCKFLAGGVVTTMMGVGAAEFIIWYKKRS